ncbi:MAG: hypothetical protein ACLP9L_04115, partial [Thermoguttaceae bacterium]
IAGSGCAIHSYAVNQLSNAVSRSGDVFASDDDPDLVKAASPFSLKLIEIPCSSGTGRASADIGAGDHDRNAPDGRA